MGSLDPSHHPLVSSEAMSQELPRGIMRPGIPSKSCSKPVFDGQANEDPAAVFPRLLGGRSPPQLTAPHALHGEDPGKNKPERFRQPSAPL